MANDDFDQNDDDAEDMVPRSHIRQLEEKARRAADLEARLAAMERETAFAKALGNAEHPGLSYFKDGYKGDLTAEAIRAAATEAGFLGQPSSEPPTAADRTPVDADLQARIDAATAGSGSAPAPDDIADQIRAAGTVDEVLALVEKAGGITTRTLQ